MASSLPLQNQSECEKKNNLERKTAQLLLWSLTKLYLHAHHFLYKLDYNSKWNTQEKIPTNIKSRRSEINNKG